MTHVLVMTLIVGLFVPYAKRKQAEKEAQEWAAHEAKIRRERERGLELLQQMSPKMRQQLDRQLRNTMRKMDHEEANSQTPQAGQ